MKYTDEIVYISFDLKLFLIFAVTLVTLILLGILLNNKYKVFKSRKLLVIIMGLLSVTVIGVGYYVSYTKTYVVANKYYDNQFEGLYTNKYINVRYFHNIGYEYTNDNISRNAVDIERNFDGDEFILKYTVNGEAKSYLFTNMAPVIGENDIYKGFQTEYHMKNYGTSLNLDMTFNTAEKEKNIINFEVTTLSGEVLDIGEIVFSANSVSSK